MDPFGSQFDYGDEESPSGGAGYGRLGAEDVVTWGEESSAPPSRHVLPSVARSISHPAPHHKPGTSAASASAALTPGMTPADLIFGRFARSDVGSSDLNDDGEDDEGVLRQEIAPPVGAGERAASARLTVPKQVAPPPGGGRPQLEGPPQARSSSTPARDSGKPPAVRAASTDQTTYGGALGPSSSSGKPALLDKGLNLSVSTPTRPRPVGAMTTVTAATPQREAGQPSSFTLPSTARGSLSRVQPAVSAGAPSDSSGVKRKRDEPIGGAPLPPNEPTTAGPLGEDNDVELAAFMAAPSASKRRKSEALAKVERKSVPTALSGSSAPVQKKTRESAKPPSLAFTLGRGSRATGSAVTTAAGGVQRRPQLVLSQSLFLGPSTSPHVPSDYTSQIAPSSGEEQGTSSQEHSHASSPVRIPLSQAIGLHGGKARKVATASDVPEDIGNVVGSRFVRAVDSTYDLALLQQTVTERASVGAEDPPRGNARESHGARSPPGKSIVTSASDRDNHASLVWRLVKLRSDIGNDLSVVAMKSVSNNFDMSEAESQSSRLVSTTLPARSMSFVKDPRKQSALVSVRPLAASHQATSDSHIVFPVVFDSFDNVSLSHLKGKAGVLVSNAQVILPVGQQMKVFEPFSVGKEDGGKAVLLSQHLDKL